jgi:diguanylate cyclase (GGDEF)-like protein/PAS domain S-box-containing protein
MTVSALENDARLVGQALSVPLAVVDLSPEGPKELYVASGIAATFELLQQLLSRGLPPHAGEPHIVVADAKSDNRFADDPAVRGSPHVRFFAAARIMSLTNQPIGVLGIFDTQPRELDETGRRTFLQLATSLSIRLEHRRVKTILHESKRRYHRAIELYPHFPWTATREGEVLTIATRWLSLVGMTLQEASEGGWHAVIHPEEQAAVLAAWLESLQSGKPFEVQYRLRLKTGDYRWVRATANAEFSPSGLIERWHGTIEDVHDRVMSEFTLSETQRRLQLALEIGNFGTWELDSATGRITSSKRFLAGFGVEGPEMLSNYEQFLARLHPEDRAKQHSAFQRVLKAEGDLHTEIRAIWPDGSVRWLKVIGRAVVTYPGGSLWVVGLTLDVTEERAIAERIRHLAYHDPLTGLANRRMLNDRLTEALANAKGGSGVGLLCVDLDQFKAINDALGHQAGDLMLQHAAGCLRTSVQDKYLVARYGGDEFAVLLENISSERDAEAVAQRILESFHGPIDLAGHVITLKCSIGIAVAQSCDQPAAQLLQHADAALYRSKLNGGTTYSLFQVAMDRAIQERQALKISLQEALDRREFKLVYQPVINTGTRQVIGFEALLRWHHPTRGLLWPADFIPLAEESGGIVAIGRWVLQEACREAADWPLPISVAVNLSPLQLKRSDLQSDIEEALRTAHFLPERLELEITETLLLEDDNETKSTLHRLRALGIRIVLDDFGTGYSSLAYLRRFRFDKIKIDKSLIKDLPDVDGGEAVMHAIAALGQSLDIPILAEGIENQAQLDLAITYGCREAQGYLLSPPLCPSEVVAMLGQGHGSMTSAEARIFRDRR